MELAEVVNPHFAVPVVGVVLCAVLVFAFGFKSPVQPPSFNFDDHEDRKNKRQKKAKQKAPSNGHVFNVDNHVASVSKQPASPKQTSSGGKVAAEKTEPLQKPKVKRAATTPKPIPKPAATEEVIQTKEEDDGGWTVALTRKDKKRGKKDEGPVSTKKEEAVLVASEPNIANVVVETPEPVPAKPQRSKKEKKQKETPVAVEKLVDVPAGDQSDKENTPEVEVVSNKAPVPTPKTDDADKVEKTSPKKKKTKKPKAPTEPELSKDNSELEPLLDKEEKPPASTKEAKVPAEEMSEKDTPVQKDISKQPPATAQVMSSDSSKPARSPKKKKKSKSPEPAPSDTIKTEPAAVPPAPSLPDQGANSSIESPLSQSSKGAVKDRLSEPVSVSSPAPSSAASSSPQPATQEDKGSTEKVSFDELGEWQEAKPVKKKKVPTATLR